MNAFGFHSCRAGCFAAALILSASGCTGWHHRQADCYTGPASNSHWCHDFGDSPHPIPAVIGHFQAAHPTCAFVPDPISYGHYQTCWRSWNAEWVCPEDLCLPHPTIVEPVMAPPGQLVPPPPPGPPTPPPPPLPNQVEEVSPSPSDVSPSPSDVSPSPSDAVAPPPMSRRPSNRAAALPILDPNSAQTRPRKPASNQQAVAAAPEQVQPADAHPDSLGKDVTASVKAIEHSLANAFARLREPSEADQQAAEQAHSPAALPHATQLSSTPDLPIPQAAFDQSPAPQAPRNVTTAATPAQDMPSSHAKNSAPSATAPWTPAETQQMLIAELARGFDAPSPRPAEAKVVRSHLPPLAHRLRQSAPPASISRPIETAPPQTTAIAPHVQTLEQQATPQLPSIAENQTQPETRRPWHSFIVARDQISLVSGLGSAGEPVTEPREEKPSVEAVQASERPAPTAVQAPEQQPQPVAPARPATRAARKPVLGSL